MRIARSFFEWQKDRDDKEREDQEVRDQAKAFRRHGPTLSGWGLFPSTLFPLGLDYEHKRMDDDAQQLRPPQYVADRIKEEQEEARRQREALDAQQQEDQLQQQIDFLRAPQAPAGNTMQEMQLHGLDVGSPQRLATAAAQNQVMPLDIQQELAQGVQQEVPPGMSVMRPPQPLGSRPVGQTLATAYGQPMAPAGPLAAPSAEQAYTDYILGPQAQRLSREGSRQDLLMEMISYAGATPIGGASLAPMMTGLAPGMALTALETGRELAQGDLKGAAGEVAIGTGLDLAIPGGMAGAGRLLRPGAEAAQTLAAPVARAIPDVAHGAPLKSAAVSRPVTAADQLLETAGQAEAQGGGRVLYHGTSGKLTQFADDRMDATALFGPGVYMTDDVDIAAGYARNRARQAGRAGREASEEVELVRLTGEERLLDLEQPLPDDVVAALRRQVDELPDYVDDAEWQAWTEAANAAQRGLPGKASYRAFSQELGGMSRFEGGDAQEGLSAVIKGLGYDGMTHRGGIRGGKAHNVTILFDPDKAQIATRELTGMADLTGMVGGRRAAGAAPEGQVFYRGTSSNQPQELGERAFLTPSREDAKTYARTNVRLHGGDEVIQEVRAAPGSVEPLAEAEGLAAQRGAVRVVDPAGITPAVREGAGESAIFKAVEGRSDIVVTDDLMTGNGGILTPSGKVMTASSELNHDYLLVRLYENASPGDRELLAGNFPMLRGVTPDHLPASADDLLEQGYALVKPLKADLQGNPVGPGEWLSLTIRESKGGQRRVHEIAAMLERQHPGSHLAYELIDDSPRRLSRGSGSGTAADLAAKAPAADAAPAVREGAEAAGEVAPTAAEKLTDILRQTTRPARREMDKLKRAELKKRVAAGARIMEQGGGEETYARAMAELKGEFPKVGATPREQMAADDIFDLYNTVTTKKGALFLTRGRVGDALTKVLAGEVPGQADIKLMEGFFGKELAGELSKAQPFGKKAVTAVISSANAVRAIQTAFDLSAPLRQGIMLVGHPKEFWGDMAPMVRAFGSDEFYETGMRQLATGPQAERRAAAGLFQADITPAKEGGGMFAEMAAKEEPFMSGLVDRIPGVRRSQHAYVYYLNKLRADVFDNTVAGWDKLGKSADELADMEQDLAKMLNVFSGRGELGAIEEFVPVLNQAFFSARLLASRPQAPTFLFRGSKHVRYIAAKDLLSFVGFGFSMLGMAKLGADAYEKTTGKDAQFNVELNPRSTDFGKIKVGPTRLDFWGGYQPIARYAAQIMTGERKTQGGDTIEAGRMSSFGRFLRSKLSPQAGFASDVAMGETFMGDEMSTDPSSLKDQAYNRLTPLFIQDFADAIRDGNMASPFMTLPAAFGASAMTYRSFSEETAAKIAEAFETGKLDASRYDSDEPLPTSMGGENGLLPTDKEKFKELYPEVQQQIEEFERGNDEKSQYFGQLDVGKDRLHGDLDRIFQEGKAGKYGNMGEQDARSAFWAAVDQKEERYVGVVINAEDQHEEVAASLEGMGPGGPTGRLIREYRELQNRHPVRETDEQWDDYEQDMSAHFTDAQVGQIRAELDVGDHEVQRIKGEFGDTIAAAGYYDVPEGRTQSGRREVMRRKDPELDAALFLLGRVSTTKSSRARTIIAQRTQEIWGGQSQAPSTSPFKGFQPPSDFPGLRPSNSQSLQPLDVR